MTMQVNKIRQELKKQMTAVKIGVVEAKGIWPNNKQGTSDSHLEVALWTPNCPHEGKKINEKKGFCSATTVQANTITPVWNEEVTFELPEIQTVIESASIICELWEKDKHFMGWIDIPLIHVANAHISDKWYPLGKRKAKDKVSGEVRLQITVFPINPLTRLEVIEENCSVLPNFFYESFWNSIFVRELVLIKCQISSLTPKVGRLLALQLLDLSENQLKALPDEIFALHDLVQLNLAQNQFVSLPKLIGNLKNLRLVNVQHNPMTDFQWLTTLDPACQVKRNPQA